MALEKELAAYEKKLPELLKDAGKFALFHGDKFEEIFTSYEDAVKAGYARFGLDPFLVKQIEVTEQIHSISRLFERV